MRFIQPLVFVVAIALLPGCSRQPDADSPLAFAPAATPYVFANLKPLPKPVLESWLALAAPYNQVQGEMLAALRADLGALPPVVQALVPLLEVTQGKLSYAGFEEMGLRPEGLSALYGIGLVPVLRMELGDADKFRKLVADYEHKRGAALPVEKIEKQDYWRLASPEPETPALILAIVEQHLVVTVDIGSKGPSLAELLGLRRPERSVLDSGELAELNDAYDFTPYGTFLLDNRRLAGALSGKDAQTAAALLPSPACQAELAGLAEAVPRTLVGYEQLEAKQLRLNAVVELREDLTTALQAVPAPVPGLGGGDRVGLEFGFGAHLDKFADFLQARSAAVAAAPFQCEWLRPFNVAGDSQKLAPLYMAAGSITGMRLTLTELRWAGVAPESVSGTAVVASPNPGALIGMVQGFLPQLAGMNLHPGGEPQRLDLGPAGGLLPAATQAPYIAMSDKGIGIAVGDDAPQQVVARLGATAPEVPPLFRMAYDGALYAQLLGGMSNMAALPQGESGTSPSSLDEAMVQVMQGIDRIEMDVLATPRGIEIRERVQLK
ncbi:MAG TPA: hypothetical protein VFV18_08695 [Porticoccaceae bacterium]|nr:hypothetical protein [Porticoccaceae bacterium]